MTTMSSSAKKNIAAVVLVVVIILAGIAATGVLYVPGLSELMGTNAPRDLGVKADPAVFSALLARENVKLTGPASNYPLTADIRYGPASPMEVTVSSAELTSLMQSTNNANGPLKNMQVRLGSNNQVEVSANADLEKYGYPLKGPVYLKGTLAKAGPGSVKVTLSEGSLGILPAPGFALQQGEDGLEQQINKQLASMPGMRIDTLSIENGQLRYTGAFPRTATV